MISVVEGLDSCEPRKSLNPSRTFAASMIISSHCNCHIRITDACFGSFYACAYIACACSERFLAHAEIYARNSGIFTLSRSSYTIILADQILLSVLKGVTVQLPLVAI